MQLAVEKNDIGVVMAWSPASSPAANAAPCKAAVPEVKRTAWRAPSRTANRSSNSPTFGPVGSQSDFRTSTTAWISASSRLCRPYGNKLFRTGLPPWMASVSSFMGKTLMSSRSWSGGGRNRLRGTRFRRHQFFQFRARQPAFVGVARITESFAQRLGIHPVFRLPPRMRRLNHVHVLGFERVPRLVFRDQHFMQLLSGTNPDGLHLASGRDRLCQIQQPHAGDLGNKDLAAMHLLQAADHEL